jgi:arsenate reductase
MINTKNINTKIFFEDAKREIIISNNRKELLTDIADVIISEYLDREKINLNFICTHNSRRSQFAQAWSFFCC